MKDKNIFVLENTVIDNTIYALVGVETDVYLLRLDMQGNQLGANNLTADIAERIISASVSKAGNKFFVTGTYSKSKKGGAEGIFFSDKSAKTRCDANVKRKVTFLCKTKSNKKHARR